MKRYILALDQGTTSSRAIIFDDGSNAVSVAQEEFEQIYPHPGWVEHDAEAIWQTQLRAAKAAMSRVNISTTDIAYYESA